MAERTVSVRLIANVAGYVAGMEKAALATASLSSTSAAKLAAQRAAFAQLGNAALGLGVAAAVGVGVAIAKFAEFDKAMSQVAAVTDSSADEMLRLRDAALDAGGRTVFTATEAANALEELGKAGFDASTSIAALDGVLDLAASGQLEVARAAEITATTLKQFGLAGSEAGHVADVLSAGAGKALGSVEDLAQGLKFVGPVAASMGVSLEETTGALALFADQGVVGEQAGTTLRGVLASLTSPSAEAAKEIERLGINLYDSNGAFLGLANVAGQLKTALGGATDAQRDMSLGVLFGNQQVTGARILVDAGAASLRKYTEQVNDSGYAASVAAERLNNLSGDVEKLGGALDTAFIKTGAGANDALRGLVQSLTFLVDAFSDLPAPAQNAALNVGAVLAVLGLSVGVSAKAVQAFADFRVALKTLEVSGRSAALGIAAIGVSVAAATLIIGYFISRAADVAATTDSLTDSLDDASGALTNYSKQIVIKKLAESGAYDAAKNLGISQKELTEAVLEGGDALDEIQGKLTDQNNIVDFFNGSGIAASNASGTIKDLAGAVAQSQENFKNMDAAADDNTNALAELEGKAQDTGGAIDQLSDIIRGFGATTLDTRDAQRQFQAAVDDAAASVAENGATLDINTEAGRKNEAALDGIAEASIEAAAAINTQTGDQQAATQAIAEGRQSLLDQLAAFGIVGPAAEAYADRLGLIPSNVSTAVALTGVGAAQREIDNFVYTNDGRTIAINVANSRNYATGGPVMGPGTATSDSITANLSNGEYVTPTRAASVPANRAALDYMRAGGVVRGFADGGPVGSFQSAGRPVGGGFNLTVNVSAGVIADRSSLAREITTLVTDGIKSGDVPVDWNG